MVVLILPRLHTVKIDDALSRPTSCQGTVIRHPQSRNRLKDRRNSKIEYNNNYIQKVIDGFPQLLHSCDKLCGEMLIKCRKIYD